MRMPATTASQGTHLESKMIQTLPTWILEQSGMLIGKMDQDNLRLKVISAAWLEVALTLAHVEAPGIVAKIMCNMCQSW